MKYIIGLMIIIPAVYSFLKYRPKNKNVITMFLVEVVFGMMTMLSTMSFDSAATALLSTGCIIGLAVMNFCFYAELSAELKRRKRKARRAKSKKLTVTKTSDSEKKFHL